MYITKMKFLITENRIKDFLKTKFDFDLTDKVRMIESYDDLPGQFKIYMGYKVFNDMLNRYGPAYLITLKSRQGEQYFLYQNRGKDGNILVNEIDVTIPERKFMESFGIDVTGLSLEDVINLYV